MRPDPCLVVAHLVYKPAAMTATATRTEMKDGTVAARCRLSNAHLDSARIR